jgi:pimeloyl-ACP methyl ester carboxylesterase
LTAATADRLAGALSAGELVTIPGAGHSVAGDQPEAFRDAVVPFLRRHAARD